MCDPPDVEPNDISEANSQNYFTICVVEDKYNFEIFPTTNNAYEIFEVRAETAYGGQNNELTISGSGVLSETASLLVWNRYKCHGSKHRWELPGNYPVFTVVMVI